MSLKLLQVVRQGDLHSDQNELTPHSPLIIGGPNIMSGKKYFFFLSFNQISF